MIDFWNTKQHPITLFKPCLKKDYTKPTKDLSLKPIELGVATDHNNQFVAVHFFGKESQKIIGRFGNIQEAREAYKNYMNFKPSAKGVYFCKGKGKFFVKYNKTNRYFSSEEKAIKFIDENRTTIHKCN